MFLLLHTQFPSRSKDRLGIVTITGIGEDGSVSKVAEGNACQSRCSSAKPQQLRQHMTLHQFVQTYIYVYTYTVPIYIYIYIYIYVCLSVCLSVCIDILIYIYIYIHIVHACLCLPHVRINRSFLHRSLAQLSRGSFRPGRRLPCRRIGDTSDELGWASDIGRQLLAQWHGSKMGTLPPTSMAPVRYLEDSFPEGSPRQLPC